MTPGFQRPARMAKPIRLAERRPWNSRFTVRFATAV
jgi:hypothetical protein